MAHDPTAHPDNGLRAAALQALLLADPVAKVAATHALWQRLAGLKGARPTRLLQRPEPIEVTAFVPDDPPSVFHWHRHAHRIVRAEGDKTRTIIDTIADNAANAGIVTGSQRHAPTADLRWVGAIVKRDGVVEETGLGAGVLDDPVTGIIWLARRMHHYGQRIEPGQIILSGSFIRALECPPGSHIDADFGPFGRLTCSFA